MHLSWSTFISTIPSQLLTFPDFTKDKSEEFKLYTTDSEFRSHKASNVVKDLIMQPTVKNFLESIDRKSTKALYKRSMELFQEYTQKPLEEILEQRKKDLMSSDISKRRKLENIVKKFYFWLITEKKVTEQTAFVYVQSLRSIFSYFNIPLRKIGIRRTATIPKDWIPTIDQLRLLYKIAGLREKLIISLAKDVPVRIGDFLKIKLSDIKPLLTKTRQPYSFFIRTEKHKIPMKCFLSEETLELLNIYVKQLSPDQRYLFSIDKDTINWNLKQLVKKAGIDVGNLRIRFHMFRKLFISTASSLGINRDIIRLLTGKKVSEDMLPYLEGVDLYYEWKKVNEYLKLSVFQSNGRIQNLEELTNLMAKALAELLKPIVEKMWLQKQQGIVGSIGVILTPDFDNMSPKQVFREYLKLLEQTNKENKQREER